MVAKFAIIQWMDVANTGWPKQRPFAIDLVELAMAAIGRAGASMAGWVPRFSHYGGVGPHGHNGLERRK